MKIGKWIGVALLFLALLPQAGFGSMQGPVPAAKTTADAYANVAIGNLGVLVTNYGKIGNADLVPADFDWPAGSGNLYLYEGRIWFGAQVSGTKRVSAGDDYEFGTDPSAKADTVLVITGDEAVSEYDTYSVMTDQVATNIGREIGIELTQRTYSWSISYLDDFIIYDLVFKNTGAADLKDCYMGFAMDCDVSLDEGAECYIDDLNGWDSENKISYMYDSDNPELPGDDTGGPNGESPGYFGTISLSSPATKDGRAGADAPSSHYWWDWNHDPGSDELKYDYMASGKFLATPASPFDYRYLQSYGPYDIPAGGSIRVLTATGLGKGLVGLQENLLAAKELFEANRGTAGKWIVSGPPASPALTVTPGDRMVTLAWGDGPEAHVDPVTGMADFEGYRVWKSATGIEGGWSLVADYDKIDGVGMNAGLPEKTGGRYPFVDHNVHNGYPYYYAVTAYDNGDLARIGSLESSKTTNKTYTSPSALANTDEDKIYVYPNPYKATAPWDSKPDLYNPSEERIRFNNIPGTCTIRIFTLSGDLIDTLDHRDGTGSADWDLITRHTQKIVSGIYLYHVQGAGVDFVDKFIVVR
ncbi:MAG: hypothetical protein V1800_15395 [Candidatus Latescibacterota bacterium]